MSYISLKTELCQQLWLTPKLLQSMELLQMNSFDLQEFLNKITEENPVLETEDSSDLQYAYNELRQKASWIDAGICGTTFSHDRYQQEAGSLDKNLEGLQPFLTDQLERLHLSEPTFALAKYMVRLLDEDGYLSDEDLSELQKMNISNEVILKALHVVQCLEPAGVGARTLSECLSLQLRRRKDVSPAIMEIVEKYLTELSQKQYGVICRKLGITLKEVLNAEKVISELEPRPGQAFCSEKTVMYIRPDVFIVEESGDLNVILNEYYLPRVSISDYYLKLFRESEEKEIKDYLRNKLRQARWLISGLERRGSTLQKCAEAVALIQKEYFKGQTNELRPMSVVSLAQELNVHPSTISRATCNKYIQCKQGTFPFRYFFNRDCGGDISAQAIKQKLRMLVKEENFKHPLSDQTICEILSKSGATISRRTVAKYRFELGIPSAAKRKQISR